jgi:hypothetical protein
MENFPVNSCSSKSSSELAQTKKNPLIILSKMDDTYKDIHNRAMRSSIF